MKYTFRDYRKGDLPRQLEIMKQVTREQYEIIPYNIDQHTVERYERWYSRPGWHPIPLKFLVYKNELVGYSGYGNSFNDFRLFYPYILEKHRTEELEQKLFDEAMKSVREASKNYASYRIYARSDIDLIHHNKFMGKQNFVEKVEGNLIEIDTEKLDKEISERFVVKFFEKKDIEKVSKFSKEITHYQQPFYEINDLLERFELGNIQPKTHLLIEEENKIKAVIGVITVKHPVTGDFVAAPNLELIDKDYVDDELRKTLYLSLSKVFKHYNVKKYRFEILQNSNNKQICEDLGFQYVEGIGGIYYFFK